MRKRIMLSGPALIAVLAPPTLCVGRSRQQPLPTPA